MLVAIIICISLSLIILGFWLLLVPFLIIVFAIGYDSHRADTDRWQSKL